jgi:hypothetical protein
MSDEPIRLRGSEIVEYFAREQAKHYDDLLTAFIRRVESYGLSEQDARKLIEETRAFLAADLERYVNDAARFVAAGGRLPREPLH